MILTECSYGDRIGQAHWLEGRRCCRLGVVLHDVDEVTNEVRMYNTQSGGVLYKKA